MKAAAAAVAAQKPVVVITGVSGYIGSMCCKYFVEDGRFTVRGTVRDAGNAAKLAPLRTALGSRFGDVELRSADLLDGDSMDRAVDGATYLVHTASPCYLATKTVEELTTPAVDGTMHALRAAARYGVKRVVLTSSRAAVAFGHATLPEIFHDDTWSDVDGLRAGGLRSAYALSKTLAEQAAWDFQRSLPAEKRFELVALNPCIVLGPSFVTPDAGQGAFLSGALLRDLLTGNKATPFFDAAEMHPTRSKLGIVDVRSVAQAHLNAVVLPGAADRRFLLVNGNYTLGELLRPLQDKYGPQGWPVLREVEGVREDVPRKSSDMAFDWTRSKEVLKVQYETDVGKVLVDMAESMIASGAVKKPQVAKM